MRNYEVKVFIRAADSTGEATEVHVGKFPAESIAPLVGIAGKLGDVFAGRKDVVAEHERLVAAQNAE